ncbi:MULTISPECIES: ABC transporter substrate-binding protein [unclassified Cryobacterium]|uniref:ABC transporter substrate-binding protein n=1 Tax=unclassified Cryobacterium TaxID=2649013 RepID=UPI001069DC4F|nr:MULTISPECIES: ABC transporter substrate-binding protein [unclassified Cryobacterium]TFB95162.1 ABC transporter substrate-binding protein [Cryobacterium sp. MDB2-A-1]TFC11197.1 ABC transporter substrate-binding protein [Cryobacterium sp. MDB2-A-2]TFC11493.1 ABC transporter substrate-binding protein [Cryobacterium sp. MDB2-33-2]TFC17560.1 ABC transporter substrate-binding protein [Cryobacterium sp. MDB2-10]
MAIKKKTAVIIGGIAAVALVAGGITAAVLAGTGNSSAQAAGAASPSASAAPVRFNLGPKQDRIRLDKVPEAIAAIKKSGFTPIEAGKLTVVVSPYVAPLGLFATDDTTLIGNETDIAQLIADGLGLELNLQPAAWADWPLGIQSGKYDLITSNVTVTEARKDLYDFASYREDLLGFYVKSDSKISSIKEAKDVAGLKVIVGSGTNQEKILQGWDKENIAKGLAPVEYQYFDDTAAANLALQSGRADANFGPNATSAYAAAQNGETRLVGTFNGGYPAHANIAAGTKKGNGLIEGVSIVLNKAITGGQYGDVLARWGLTSEGVTESLVNPAGLPRE